MSSAKDKPQNVGDKLRRYEKLDVTLHLACNVTLTATTFYNCSMKTNSG